MGRIKALKGEDVFGQMLWAFYKEREVFEVFERDDGYIYIDSPKAYFSGYNNWAFHQKQAMEFVEGRVLDVGCGVGRNSLYLQKKGLEVLGIDASPLAVKICRLRGVNNVKVMPIEKINFRKNSFNTILMMGNNFSLFGSFKKARKLLEKFKRITTEKARIIAETIDPYKRVTPASLKYYEFNKAKGRMSGQLRVRIRLENYVSEWFDWLKVSKGEMKEILDGTSWRVKEFIESENLQYITIIEKVTK
jgi:SAM-dependent methyltransferase